MVDIDKFKSALDLFLKRVEDKPLLRSAANNGRHNNSNHLFDTIDSYEDIKQDTVGFESIPHSGDASTVLPRRRTSVRMDISRM